MSKIKYRKLENSNIRPQVINRVKAKETLKLELKEIDKWLGDNDWKINKIVVGEWTTEDSRWKAYVDERITKRSRRDEIVALLGVNNNESDII